MGSKENGTDTDKVKNQVMLLCQNEITEKWLSYFQHLGEKNGGISQNGSGYPSCNKKPPQLVEFLTGTCGLEGICHRGNTDVKIKMCSNILY